MIDATGYGPRIEQAILDLQSQIGRRLNQDQVGEIVAGVLRRPESFTASTVNGWIKERSEPTLSVFLALAALSGRQAAWIAFGDRGVVTDAERAALIKGAAPLSVYERSGETTADREAGDAAGGRASRRRGPKGGAPAKSKRRRSA